ncbi:L-leucine ABC transporter ATP-binding protein /L-isoleucine ABC transporter ATP-binding protein /L-valine ABC transporter ATP-binding protein [Labedella gwakjiensis]|uniref:ABC transporter ATP-binding protein n=1 Tax=Labedella gwakjiensis TaxID=390269 RepID=A0A2P8GWK9_9MICO|nr:ABC transporter ATP-binding protein [Labedella gwakjiensis]PSL38342.1 L-leucine ABC transporter ATP-binding protein /L-isoleucine ABC transporter ATP-binding protein /L-valine ABC transporter ATP-binding protein [Labedella gwakjiensis]RUQ87125.1 ABC transporter ATP-binding protein [Labedella gwakjiensis]
MSAVLEVSSLGMRFGGLVALQGVDVTLEGEQVIGLIGPNGAGKSTLLNALSGFTPPTEGTVRLDGRETTRFTPQQYTSAGLVRSFQTAQLLEDETVVSNLLLGRQRFSHAGPVRQIFGWPPHLKSERAWLDQAYAALDLLGLLEFADARASSLSTATRRLVEIGRVLLAEPRIVFLDEPAAGLDAASREHLAEVLRSLPGRVGCLIVLVEHDVNIVRRACDRCIALSAGSVLADGPTDEVLARPDVRVAYFGESDAVA